MTKKYAKQLGKDSLLYGLGGIVSRGIAFFLLPVYTRIFTTGEYGTLELLSIIANLIGMVAEMRMNGAQSFYFFEQSKFGQKAQRKLVSANLQFRLLWGSCTVIAAMFISPLLNKFFFNVQISWEYFAIAFTSALFFQLTNQSAQVFRLLYRPGLYVGITLCQNLCSAAIAIILIVGLSMGIMGFLIGTLAGSFFSALFGWWLIRDYLDWSRWHVEWWPKLFKFGAPLLPDSLAFYVLLTSDRWFISYFLGQEMLGLYALGSKFAMLVVMVVTTFRQAWWPVAMDAMHGGDGPVLYRAIARVYLGCGISAIVLLTALSPNLVSWLAAPAYAQAYPIVGILAWCSIFEGFYSIGAVGIWKAEKTILTPIFSGSAALLNVSLNTWLIPRYGAIGAALATAVSFCLWNISTILVSERLWQIKFPFAILGGQVVIGVGACFAILQMYDKGIFSPAIAFVTAVSVVPLIALSAKREQWTDLMNHIKKKLGDKQWLGSRL